MVWPAANAIYRRETHDNYPAAKAILHSVYEGLQLPFDLALRVEVALVRQDPALARGRRDDPHAVHFDGRIEQGRAASRAMSRQPRSRRVGILGAGFMGAGIAYVTASAGMDVVLIDQDQAAADKGKEICDKLISGAGAEGPREGRRQGSAACQDQGNRRLQRSCRLRSRDRSGFRGSRGQGRGDAKGARGARRRARSSRRTPRPCRLPRLRKPMASRKISSAFIFSRRSKKCCSSR